jgi:NAD(P)H dehydrogenase (quinone)
MKTVIVYAHPNPASFNHAVLEILQEKLAAPGHDVAVRDLYAGGFDPLLKASDFEAFQKGTVPPDIRTEQDLIREAGLLCFVFPVWWFQMPAVLKGYVDRVFSRGFAYDVDPEKGLTGLLDGKKCMVVKTTGGPEEQYEANGLSEALHRTLIAGNFEFCGLEVVLHHTFYAVPFVDRAAREAMLAQFREMKLPV